MVPAHRFLVLLVLASAAFSQDIVFGQSTVLNNSNFFVGEALAIGIKAAFLDANLKGGVLGKNLELYTLDDSNEPAKTINNTLQFVSNSSIFAIIGYTGTSGIQGSLPHVLKTDYPLLGPFSGSLSLRVPFNKQIINLRPSYSDETTAMVNYLVNIRQVRRISLFYQDDGFGQSGLTALETVLTVLNMNISSTGKYARNTLNIDDALYTISKGSPEAILIVATTSMAAQFISYVQTNKTLFHNAVIFALISTIDTTAPPMRALKNVEVVGSQVVPPVTSLSYAIVREYRTNHRKIDPTGPLNAISLEGYILGKMISIALLRTPGLTSSTNRTLFTNSFYDVVERYLLGLQIGPYTACSADDAIYPLNSDTCACNQGLRSIWIVSISNGTVQDIPSGYINWKGSCFLDPKVISQPILFGLVSCFRIKINNKIASTDTGPKYETRSGIQAAFASFNARGGYNGRQLIVRSVFYSSLDPTTYDPVYHTLLESSLVGLTGISDTQFIEYMLPKFISSKIPVIGPAVGPTLLFNYNRNIINVRSSYEDEITGIVNYLVNTRVIRKIGFVYQVFAGGIDMYQSFLRVLSVTELPSSGIYAMNSTNDIRAACDQLFINNVEAIIVASRGASYAALFMNCMRDRNSTVPMITTSIVDQATLTLLLHKFNDILMSQVVPSLTDTSIQLPSMFLSALNTSFPNKTPTSLSLSGYITGKLITSVLSSMLENGIRQVNQKTFLDSLYRGISYVIGGVHLGEFKDQCNGTSTCCNNGATAVYIASLDSKGSLWQQEKVSYTSCVLGSIIRLPFVFGRSANTTNDDYEKGLRAGFEEINDAGGIRGRKVKLKSHPSYGNATKLRRWLNHMKSENVMGFVGLDRTDDNVMLEFAAMKTIPIIGTFSGVTALREPYNQYLVNLRASLVDQAAAILDTIKHLELKSTLVVYEGNSTYWKQAVTGIISYAKVLQFTTPETVTIEQLVPNLLKTTYDAVVIFADAQVVKKITSVVSLYSSNSTTFSAYDTEQPNTDYVAQAVPSVQNAYTEGYMTAQLIGLSLKQATNDSVREFIESMYTLSVFSINGVRLGPISGTCTKANTFCDCNQLTHHVPVTGKKTTTLQFTSCGVSLALPPVQDIAGAVALLVVLFLVIIFAIAFSIIVTLVLIWWCRRSHASLKNAPRTGEMVLAFTDVQNSTKLWSNLGNDMAKALKIHNMVIRKLIEQYEGYEVKTQGDSFMVCFEDPIRAVMWALHVQKELVQQRWDPVLTRAFDCRIEFNESEQIVFNGLRVRMGLHFGYAERMYDKVTKRYDYFGSTVNCAARVESEAKGGQVFVSGALFDAIAETIEMVDHFQYSVLWEGSPGDQVTLLEPEQIMITTSPKVGSVSLGEQILYRRVGDFQLKGIEGHVTIYELMCESLYLRNYDPPKSSATGTPSHQRSYRNVRFADDMESDRISNISIQIDEYLPRALLEIHVTMHCDDEQDKIFVELKPC